MIVNHLPKSGPVFPGFPEVERRIPGINGEVFPSKPLFNFVPTQGCSLSGLVFTTIGD